MNDSQSFSGIKISIFIKFVLMVSLLLLIILGASGYFLISNQAQDLYSKQEDENRRMLNLLADMAQSVTKNQADFELERYANILQQGEASQRSLLTVGFYRFTIEYFEEALTDFLDSASSERLLSDTQRESLQSGLESLQAIDEDTPEKVEAARSLRDELAVVRDSLEEREARPVASVMRRFSSLMNSDTAIPTSEIESQLGVAPEYWESSIERQLIVESEDEGASGRPLGEVEVVFSDLPIQERVQSSVVRFVVAMLVTLLVVNLLVAALLRFVVTRPLRGLTNAANQLSENDFDITIKRKPSDEIGFLGSTIEKAAGDLRESFESLRALNHAAQLLSGKRDETSLFKEALQRMSVLTKSQRGVFAEFTDNGLEIRASYDQQEIDGKTVSGKLDEKDQLRHRFILRQVQLMGTLADVDYASDALRRFFGDAHHVLQVPLFDDRGIRGVTVLARSKAFNDQELELGKNLQSRVQSVLHNIEVQRNEVVKERLQKEMELAEKIQTSILPQIQQSDENRLDALMITADEVGGDYYDIIRDNLGREWYGIGDVSGHGLTSGLVMLMTQSIVSTAIQARPEMTPKEVASLLNQVLHENLRNRLKEDYFLTFALIRNNGNGNYTVSGAHEDLLIYRAATQTVEKIPLVGVWFGIVGDISHALSDMEFHLAPGDMIFLYTDGVIEAKNDKKEQWDVARFEQSIIKHADLEPKTMHQAILNDLRTFMDVQEDDITMLMVKDGGEQSFARVSA